MLSIYLPLLVRNFLKIPICWVFYSFAGHLSSSYKANSALPLGSSNNPKKTSLLNAEGSANKPATLAPFPRRLGVQINDAAVTQSASGSILPTNVGAQIGSK